MSRGVIFQPMYVWSVTLNPFWHLSEKMFFPFIIIIILFTCCGSFYIGRTNQRQDARIKQVLTKIRNFMGGPTDNLRIIYRSLIAEHLINIRACTEKFSIDFSLYWIINTLHFIWKFLRRFIFCPLIVLEYVWPLQIFCFCFVVYVYVCGCTSTYSVCMCMCVCVCTHTYYACVCMCVCVCVYKYVLCVCVCVCIQVCTVCVCMCKCTSMFSECVYTSMYSVCVCVCVCTSMYSVGVCVCVKVCTLSVCIEVCTQGCFFFVWFCFFFFFLVKTIAKYC